METAMGGWQVCAYAISNQTSQHQCSPQQLGGTNDTI